MARVSRFQKRFLALSFGLHLAPAATLAWWWLEQPTEQPPPSSSAAPVSLVWVESPEGNEGSTEDIDEVSSTTEGADSAPAVKRPRVPKTSSPSPKLPTKRAQRASGLRAVVAADAKNQVAPVEASAEEGGEGPPEHLPTTEAVEAPQSIAQVEEPDGHEASTPEPATESESAEPTEVRASKKGRAAADRERIVGRIKKRVEDTLPLSFWEPSRRGELIGRVKIRFKMKMTGYVYAYDVLESSGDQRADRAAHDALHLAEPLPYLPGWVELELDVFG